MALTTKDFDKWMKRVGPIKSDIEDSKLTTAQIKILKEYPECQTANDLPFDISSIENVRQLLDSLNEVPVTPF